ncbi:hypothetical protein H4R33_002415 [Dimargaris cristalligena]|nr:hypothetical protein H4R33_002415 [Dimargaris cristalligena]
MLSRQPTRLTLTPTDLNAFEERRLEYAQQHPELLTRFAETIRPTGASTTGASATDPQPGTLEAKLAERTKKTTAQRIGLDP